MGARGASLEHLRQVGLDITLLMVYIAACSIGLAPLPSPTAQLMVQQILILCSQAYQTSWRKLRHIRQTMSMPLFKLVNKGCITWT